MPVIVSPFGLRDNGVPAAPTTPVARKRAAAARKSNPSRGSHIHKHIYEMPTLRPGERSSRTTRNWVRFVVQDHRWPGFPVCGLPGVAWGLDSRIARRPRRRVDITLDGSTGRAEYPRAMCGTGCLVRVLTGVGCCERRGGEDAIAGASLQADGPPTALDRRSCAYGHCPESVDSG
jgi:hypothetical protein